MARATPQRSVKIHVCALSARHPRDNVTKLFRAVNFSAVYLIDRKFLRSGFFSRRFHVVPNLSTRNTVQIERRALI